MAVAEAVKSHFEYGVDQSQDYPYDSHLGSLDLEQWQAEDKLGCARGILWSLIFEAALAALCVLYWKFHFFRH
jgi:hypothetical protein